MPGTKMRSRTPSPMTWYATLRSPLLAYRVGPTSANPLHDTSPRTGARRSCVRPDAGCPEQADDARQQQRCPVPPNRHLKRLVGVPNARTEQRAADDRPAHRAACRSRLRWVRGGSQSHTTRSAVVDLRFDVASAVAVPQGSEIDAALQTRCPSRNRMERCQRLLQGFHPDRSGDEPSHRTESTHRLP